jgi:hypothetical protein
MDAYESRSVEVALQQIEDGTLWERFGSQFMGALIGSEFVPVGGILDKGIDGLEHIVCRRGSETKIYQMSKEASVEMETCFTHRSTRRTPSEGLSHHFTAELVRLPRQEA